MEKILSIRDLVNLWPTRAAMADDIRDVLHMVGANDVRVTTAQVHKWAENGSIPPRYHQAIFAAGRRRGFALSAELIIALHAPGCRNTMRLIAARTPEGDAA